MGKGKTDLRFEKYDELIGLQLFVKNLKSVFPFSKFSKQIKTFKSFKC